MGGGGGILNCDGMSSRNNVIYPWADAETLTEYRMSSTLIIHMDPHMDPYLDPYWEYWIRIWIGIWIGIWIRIWIRKAWDTDPVNYAYKIYLIDEAIY